MFGLLTTPRLAAFDASDKNRRIREEVLNSLEAFTYRSRDYLDDESFIAASTAEIRSSLEEKLSGMSDWIYAEGHDATEKTLRAKLKELEDIVNPILKRKEDAVERPEAIKQFESNIADVKTAVGMIKSQIEEQNVALSKSAEAASKASASSTSSPSASSSADPLAELEEEDMLKASASESATESEPSEVPIIYTEEDLKFLEETYTNATNWLKEKQEAQKKLKESDDPAFTTKDIKAESEKLNAAIMQMMMKKARHYNIPKSQKAKPKPKKKPAKKAPKKPKKGDKPAEDRKEPTQEELDEALEKAGLKKDGFKLKNFAKEMKDEKGRLLTKLELGEDATEEEIMAAIDRATKEGKERLAEEKRESERAAQVTGTKKHDEL